METVLKYHSNNVKIDISKINNLNDLINQIKVILKIDSNKEIDIYVLPDNTYLKQSNFQNEFLNKKKLIQGLSVIDVIDLEEKIKNIGINNPNIPINKIQEDSDSFDNDNSIVLDKHKLFKGQCSFCKNTFNSSKYSCLLCPNYYLCNKCEENHPHPMIKYKSDNLSDNISKIITIHSYTNKKDFQDKVKEKLGVKKINQVQLRTNLSCNSFLIGSNQERILNLIIKNNNKFTIPKNTLSIVIQNQYDLNISIKDEVLFKDINPGIEVPINLNIKSNDKNLFETYHLKIEVMSNSLDIISKPIELIINVKNDKEEDELNNKFKEFPSIILLPKEKKKKLQYIIQEKLSLKTPQEIKAIMEKFKWSIDQAIIDLTN